jgi:hypothetical protein
MKVSHSGRKTPLFKGNSKLFSGVKKRLSGQRKFGNQWVSKERKRLAKKVMKHDGDFQRQHTYAKDVGPFQIKKKVGTKAERQRAASNMVAQAFKGVRGTKSTKKNTLPMEQYLSYGMSKKQKSQMDAATASLSGKDLEKSLMNRYYGRKDRLTENAMATLASQPTPKTTPKTQEVTASTPTPPTSPKPSNATDALFTTGSTQASSFQKFGDYGFKMKRGGKIKNKYSQYD